MLTFSDSPVRCTYDDYRKIFFDRTKFIEFSNSSANITYRNSTEGILNSGDRWCLDKNFFKDESEI